MIVARIKLQADFFPSFEGGIIERRDKDRKYVVISNGLMYSISYLGQV